MDDLPTNFRMFKAPSKNFAIDDESIPYEEGLVISPKIDGCHCFLTPLSLTSSKNRGVKNRQLYTFTKELRRIAVNKKVAFDFILFSPSFTGKQLEEILHTKVMDLPSDLIILIADAIPMCYLEKQAQEFPFSERLHMMFLIIHLGHEIIRLLPQDHVDSVSDAQAAYAANREVYKTGSIVRALQVGEEKGKVTGGWYKFGRATPTQKMIWRCK